MTTHALGSVVFSDNSDYQCSNGKTYDVLRGYSGGWGTSHWQLLAVCSQEILKKNRYEYNGNDSEESRLEIEKCVKEVTPEVEKCYEEFVALNGSNGASDLPLIKHFNGTVGATCEDKISKAKDDVDLIRADINNPYFSYAKEYLDLLKKDLDDAIRIYGLVVQECNDKKKSKEETTVTRQ